MTEIRIIPGDLQEECDRLREENRKQACQIDMLLEVIQTAPQVIRCGDCALCDKHGHRCKYWNHGVSAQDFYSHAMKEDVNTEY